MRCVRLILRWGVPVIAGAVALGCLPSGFGSSARAQSGSLLARVRPAREQRMRPPSGAAGQPARREEHAGKAPPPVAPPRGQSPPQKPHGAAPAAAPAKPAPAKPAPVETPPP